MNTMARALAENFRLRLERTICATLRERGLDPDEQRLRIEVGRALEWSSGLKFERSDTERLAEIVCRRFGGFPNGPLPKPAMKVLYRRELPPPERLSRLEAVEI
jgi:hypothetical protein